MPEGMKVVGYVRVSTDEQAEGGVSLADQRNKVRLYAELHGLDLVTTIDDPGASAKTLDRPGLARALAMLDAREADGLVVVKLDRLTRELGDWSALITRYFGERGGRSLMSVSESIDTRSAAGRMVLNMMMTVAQWERETIVERTRAAMKFKRDRGERISRHLPYGKQFGPDGRLVDDPAEVRVLARIAAMDGEGRSLRAIAAELNAGGIPAKSGGTWSHSTVGKLLPRARALGREGEAA